MILISSKYFMLNFFADFNITNLLYFLEFAFLSYLFFCIFYLYILFT